MPWSARCITWATSGLLNTGSSYLTGTNMVNLANCRRLGTRHGDYWHAYPPDAPRAVCGITRPIFAAADARHRPMCPRCQAYFQSGGDAVAVRSDAPRAQPLVTPADPEPQVELRIGGRHPVLYGDGRKVS